MTTEGLNYGDSLKKAVEYEALKNNCVRQMIVVLKECGFGRKYILATAKKDLKGVVRPSLIVHFVNEVLNIREQNNPS